MQTGIKGKRKGKEEEGGEKWTKYLKDIKLYKNAHLLYG
jgi:hypothetical protein